MSFRRLVIFISLLKISIQISVYDDVTQYPGDECLRECSYETRICYFKWHLEHYNVLGAACGSCGTQKGNFSDCFNKQCITADGFERGVMSINRLIPGPSIHVCQNDLIVVDVVNMMGGTSATIHWHGFHQVKTPWMDGVPFVTQCPIHFGSTFRYSFVATQPGTQFYHSHSGHHKVNGIYGGIVVRKPLENDLNAKFYDHDNPEHLMVVSDWMEKMGEEFMPGLRNNVPGTQPTSFLINGKGIIINRQTGRPRTSVPLAVFRVQAGQRYRFRFVNSMSHVCPALLEIENHAMQVVASDSYDLQPVRVDSLVSTSGERYDFVINANQLPGTYWIRLKGVGPCAARELQQFAILAYSSNSTNDISLSRPRKPFPPFKDFFAAQSSLNHPNTTCGVLTERKNHYCITDLLSYVEAPEITEVPYDYQFILNFQNRIVQFGDAYSDDYEYHFMDVGGRPHIGNINDISFHFPPFPPLTQPEDVFEEMFCDETNLPERCNGKSICPCIHRLKVQLNSIVELVIIDGSSIVNTVNHPFHLHGYQLHVTGLGQMTDNFTLTVDKVRNMLKFQPATYRLKAKKHVIKDTISIPSKGFTIFRFKATNPGFWLLHCHFEWHMAVGMGLVLQVGELHEMLPPPDNFPKCNAYTPNIDTGLLSSY